MSIETTNVAIANPFLKTYRFLRSLAGWKWDGLCRAIENRFLEPEVRAGGQR